MKKLLMAAVGLVALVGVAVQPNAAHAVAFLSNWTFGGGTNQDYAPNGGATLVSDATSVIFATNSTILTIVGPAGAVTNVLNFAPGSIGVPAGASGVEPNLFTLTWSTYTFTATSGNYDRSAGTDSISFLYQGNFTDSTAALDNQSASLSFSFSQTAAGNQPSFSGTFNSPSGTQVPEPATLALLGAGLVGLGAIRRRRQRA